MKSIFAFVLIILMVGPASAQTKRAAIPTLLPGPNCIGLLCGLPVLGPLPNPILQIQAITVADLQNALEDAETHKDERHAKCWRAAVPIAQQWQNPISLPKTVGVASLVQQYFDINSTLNQPLIPDALVEACAETVSDLGTSMLSFASSIGIKSISIQKPF